MIKEAIILAGGIGSRLKAVLHDRPKCLAPIDGTPFLSYLIRFLQGQGIEHFIFSLGYKHEMVVSFLETVHPGLHYDISIEKEALGTGGGIQLACEKAIEENTLICNGDTFFKADLQELATFHQFTHADCTLALKPMLNFDRYGTVELSADSRIRIFREKEFRESGLINGGIYILKIKNLLLKGLPEKFSFEKDFLEKAVASREKIYGCIQDSFFIDIGIPEDLARAQHERELLGVLIK